NRQLARGSAAAGTCAHAERTKIFASLAGLDRAGIALDHAIKFAHAFVFLAQFNQRQTLFQLGGCRLVATGILLQDFVVILDGLLEVALAIFDIRHVELGISGEIGVGVVLQVVGKLLACQIVFPGVVITQSVVIQDVRRWGLRGRLIL